MATKRHRKARTPATMATGAAAPAEREAPAAAAARSRMPALFGAFFALLLLACSPFLDSKFSLPKLAVLAWGTLVFSALLAARAWRGRIAADSRTLLIAAALGLWWIGTTPFSLHLPTALNGEYDYYNGLWSHLCCLALFVAAMSLPARGDVPKIAAGLVGAIALVALVNVLHAAGMLGFGLVQVSTLGDRVGAAALMNFAMPLAVVALLGARGWAARAGLGALLALLLLSEFISQGRGAWVGLVAAAVVLAAGLPTTPAGRWKTLAAIAACAAVFAGLAAKFDPAVAQRFASFARVGHDEALEQRFVYYRAALRMVADHPLAGIGFENFRNAYPAYRGADDTYFFSNVIPTMVHDGYLEAAVNNGVPALLLYVALVAAVLVRLLRELRRGDEPARRRLDLALLAALVAYLVQDLTGWLNLGLAPVFWIVLGLAANRTAPDTAVAPARTPALVGATAALMVAVSAYLAYGAGARLTADTRLFQASTLDLDTRWNEVEARIAAALAALPADTHTEGTAAQLYGRRYVATHDPALYAKAHALFEASHRHNPFDRMRLINLLGLEFTALKLGQIRNSSEFAQEALRTLARTDADNPAFHAFKAQLLAAEGRHDAALAAIGEARRLAPRDEQLQALEAQYRRSAQGN